MYSKDILSAQINIIKSSLTSFCNKLIIPFVFSAFVIGAVISQKQKGTVIVLAVVLLILLSLAAVYIARRARILKRLKSITDIKIHKKTIDVEKVDFLIRKEFSKAECDHIIAVIFYDRNKNRYIYPMTETADDIPETRELIKNKLDLNNLRIYYYADTNLVALVENFPENIDFDARFPQKNIVHYNKNKK